VHKNRLEVNEHRYTRALAEAILNIKEADPRERIEAVYRACNATLHHMEQVINEMQRLLVDAAMVAPRVLVVCKHGDPLCPCPDGDMCHYEGPNPWKAAADSTKPPQALAGGTSPCAEKGDK